MSQCAFCSIVAEESPAYRLYENEKTLAFLDIEPATLGHTLVIPKAHHETVTDMSKSLAGSVFKTVHRVACGLESVYQLEGYNIIQTNGSAAGQDVFHAHVHIIPRYGDETLTIGWDGETIDETTQQKVAEKVRDHLASQL